MQNDSEKQLKIDSLGFNLMLCILSAIITTISYYFTQIMLMQNIETMSYTIFYQNASVFILPFAIEGIRYFCTAESYKTKMEKQIAVFLTITGLVGIVLASAVTFCVIISFKQFPYGVKILKYILFIYPLFYWVMSINICRIIFSMKFGKD